MGLRNCSSEAAATQHQKAFPAFVLHKLAGLKNPVSYPRLERKVPFGTDGFNAGSRNLAALQNNTLRPRLS
jgi:hypothetical protein